MAVTLTGGDSAVVWPSGAHSRQGPDVAGGGRPWGTAGGGRRRDGRDTNCGCPTWDWPCTGAPPLEKLSRPLLLGKGICVCMCRGIQETPASYGPGWPWGRTWREAWGRLGKGSGGSWRGFAEGCGGGSREGYEEGWGRPRGVSREGHGGGLAPPL